MSEREESERFLEEEDVGKELITEYLLQADNGLEFELQNSNSNMNNAKGDGDSLDNCTTFQDVIGIAYTNPSRLSPLGLKLTISPSFLSLLESKLSSNRDTHDSHQHMSKRSRMSASGSTLMSEKLKASNFPIASIAIGQWQRFSRHEGDLTAKLYYAKRKIVWEVLDGALKSKMEILWSEITSMKVTMEPNQPAVLEIELDRPPLFYREGNPQPRKHTIWHQSSDFTGGQASCIRKHGVSFPPGVFDKYYEKLLQCDQRLLKLSREPFPSRGSPYFNSIVGGGYSLPFLLNGYNLDSLQQSHSGCVDPTTGGILSPVSLTPNPTITSTDFPYANENMISFQMPTLWDGAMNLPVEDIENAQGATPYAGSNQDYNNPPNYHPSRVSLTDIEQHLLEDTQMSPSDESALQAQVETMCSLLEPGDNADQSQNMDYQVVDPSCGQNPTEDMLPSDDFSGIQSINWRDDDFEIMIPVTDIIDPFMPPSDVANDDPLPILHHLSDVWK